MLVFESDSFKVTSDSLYPVLRLECSKRLVFNEFKVGLVKALEFAEQNKVKTWLLDLRTIGCLNEEEQCWLHLSLFPMLMSTMGTNNFIAEVLSENCYHSLLLEAGKYGLKSYNSFIIINTFNNLDEATAWLEEVRSPLQIR